LVMRSGRLPPNRQDVIREGGTEPTRPPLWVWGGGDCGAHGEEKGRSRLTEPLEPLRRRCCNYTRNHSAGQSQQQHRSVRPSANRQPERLPKHAAHPRDGVAGCRLCRFRAAQRPLITHLWGCDSAGSCCCWQLVLVAYRRPYVRLGALRVAYCGRVRPAAHCPRDDDDGHVLAALLRRR